MDEPTASPIPAAPTLDLDRYQAVLFDLGELLP